MKDQLQTIREALLDARSLLHDGRRQDKALTALDQIEKMVGSQVPVAWGMQHTDGAILDVISPEEHAREEGGYVVPLYRAAPLAQQPQAEAAPVDMVRDAAPIPDHELVTMYDERPTSDLEMIEFAREVERRHGIGVQPQHITDGSPCWCNPDVAYTDPETGASVIVHRRPQ